MGFFKKTISFNQEELKQMSKAINEIDAILTRYEFNQFQKIAMLTGMIKEYEKVSKLRKTNIDYLVSEENDEINL